jgi:hypothetical protein
MNRDHLMRRALWATAGFNLIAAAAFAFPASELGRLAGLPAAVPLAYRALLAFLVLLFGGTYAWLARRPRIDRPLVGFAAIGKAGVFAVVALLWLGSEIPGRSVIVAGGDLVFAGIFAWWLANTGREE